MVTKEIEELLAAPPKRSSKVCAVTFALDTFDEETRKSLETIIDRPNADIGKIAAFFVKHNLDVPANSIWRHRWRLRGNGSGCKCPVNT